LSGVAGARSFQNFAVGSNISILSFYRFSRCKGLSVSQASKQKNRHLEEKKRFEIREQVKRQFSRFVTVIFDEMDNPKGPIVIFFFQGVLKLSRVT